MIWRTVFSQIEHSIDNKPVTLITGARQVGKTTLCKKLSNERGIEYVTLRDVDKRELARNDPGFFLEMHPCPLIIDEVQYAPQLFDAIVSKVDEARRKDENDKGMYILTGSQAYSLMEGITESMAGRVSIIRVSTLSLSEIMGREEEPFAIDVERNMKRSMENSMAPMAVAEAMIRGAYPETASNSDLTTDEFYSDYVDSYINRDVSQIINIRNKEKFHSFLQVMASLSGQELVYDNIAKVIGIDMKTCKSWVSALITGDIVHLLQPYAERSTVKRVVKRPKMYFWDTGLACHLARIPDAKTLMASYMKGPMVETYIIDEIMKTYRNARIEPSLYYYRSTGDNEIDFVMVREGKVSLIECKAGISFSESDAKGFDKFNSNFENGGKCIICLTEKPYPIRKDVYVLPVTAI